MKTIAFIPVRGGSKSIPLKNIKNLCGKPLVCWCIEALEACKSVDQIVVATDSDKIRNTVESFGYAKVLLYRRSAENAQDTSSTESVMLEYINYAKLSADTVFMLVQATSPLTQTIHFQEALEMYEQNTYDSILTCVHTYRFFWRTDGSSKNYDYKNRPRRQNFAGELMENGAFYINTVGNIVKYGNRLSGKIGIYEMPEYTATEIDEPDDWVIMENLIKRHVLNKRTLTNVKKIKLFLTDVDGTLTDGGMYYSENGECLKKFNTKDGMGFQLLREAGVKTGIITSETTNIVQQRASKIKADYIIQGKSHSGKLAAAEDICRQEGIGLCEVAYIGDDINDIELLEAVGLKACPADASISVKSINGIRILSKNGGDGVFREFVDSYLS